MFETSLKFENVDQIKNKIGEIMIAWNLLDELSNWTDDSECDLYDRFAENKIKAPSSNFSDAMYYLALYQKILEDLIVWSYQKKEDEV